MRAHMLIALLALTACQSLPQQASPSLAAASEAYLAWLKDSRDWLPSVTTRDVQVTQFGQTGRVTGTWVIPEAGMTIQERFVHIWVLQHGRWQMISHQVSVIPTKDGDGP